MGRKKIEKAPKKTKAEKKEETESEHEEQPAQESHSEEPAQKAAPKKRGGKAAQAKAAKDTNDLVLFSENFNAKVDSFKSFYQEFLTLKSNGGEAADQLQNITQQVRDKIEEVTKQVLKEQVSEAEKWINEQQEVVRGQIANTEKAEENTRKNLTDAGTFTEAEIDTQVQGIRSKKVALESALASLEEVKERARALYAQSGEQPNGTTDNADAIDEE